MINRSSCDDDDLLIEVNGYPQVYVLHIMYYIICTVWVYSSKNSKKIDLLIEEL